MMMTKLCNVFVHTLKARIGDGEAARGILCETALIRERLPIGINQIQAMSQSPNCARKRKHLLRGAEICNCTAIHVKSHDHFRWIGVEAQNHLDIWDAVHKYR